jgi:hypothetical protein
MKLSTLSPGETLVVLQGRTTIVKDVLKYTMMDLLLKGVLALEDVQRQSHPRDRARQYRYVSTGKNFKDYSPLNHELVFLTGFRKSNSMRFLFKSFVQAADQNAGSHRLYLTRITSSTALLPAFSKSLIDRLTGDFKYSQHGVDLKKSIEEEKEHLERTLPDLMIKDKPKALEILRLIGGNIFLLSGLEFELLKEIDELLMRELVEPTEGGYGCFSIFDTLGDSHHSSGGHDSDGGCSSDGGGDSGCGSSGCSGCGGCGGGD